MADLDELPVLQVFEPTTVTGSTFATIHDATGRQVGTAEGTAYGRGHGIEIKDAGARPMVLVRRDGKRVVVTDGAGGELGQLVIQKHVFSGPEWDVRVRGVTVALVRRTRRGGLHATIAAPDGTVLATVDGTPAIKVMLVETAGSFVLTRHHPPDPRWGLLELGALFGMDAVVRSANAGRG